MRIPASDWFAEDAFCESVVKSVVDAVRDFMR